MTPKQNLLLFSLMMLPITSFGTPLNDPTMPADYSFEKAPKTASLQNTKASQPKWVLNSTVIDPYQKIAVINGKQLIIGDEIEGATITDISHQQVELLSEDIIIVLSLERSFISRLKPSTNN